MTIFWGVVAYVLYLYLIIVLARLVVDMTHQFARSWRPSGVAAVGIELVYVSTDPPVKVLRRALPPLRIGGVSLDLSMMVLILLLIIVQGVAESFML